MKPWAKKFYFGKAWRACRQGYIDHRMSIDGGLCECCHEEPGYIVHHKILLTPQNINDPDISLNWEHLSYECKACHDQHEGHGVGAVTPVLCLFDDEGNVLGIRKEFERNRV